MGPNIKIIIVKLTVVSKMRRLTNITSESVSPSARIPNPEAIYGHMTRMQSLLEQYDRQNLFLNRQVLDLLGRKQNIVTQPYISTSKIQADSKYKPNFSHKLQRSESSILASSKIDNRGGSVDKREESASKRYYNYVGQSRGRNGQKGRQNKAAAPPKYKYFYGDEVDAKRTDLKKGEVHRPFKLVPEPEAVSKQNSKAEEKSQRLSNFSPERRSMILVEEEEVQKGVIQSRTKQKGSKISDINESANYMPIIKRQVYFRPSPEQQPKQHPSPEKASRLSLKSNRSSKSGIQVTLSQKSETKSKQKYKQSQQKKQKQEQKQKSEQQSKLSFKLANVSGTQTHVEVVPSPKPPLEQPQIKTSQQTPTFKLGVKMIEPGLNRKEETTEAHKIAEEVTHSLFRNRSSSQHQLQPSQKIIYEEHGRNLRSGSKKQPRGRSAEGKKKFISLVSLSLRTHQPTK